MDVKKEYTNGDITVVWQPGKCIHSENCFHGLPNVFKPKEKPWIDTSGATSAEMMSQVNKCPSGALSAYVNSEKSKEEVMSKIKIQVFENGPLRVTGDLEITHKDGSSEVKETAASFCRCGHSSNKPFCDGSHKKEGFIG
ncbi:(4Fe-4S)-binding protein [Fulvivirga sp.]|uniref:(4Fe-4S)-binding protein n=1 Tax=Fulvivirga sp. TaxID=1931237 RepID=UPI0032EC538D